MERLRKHVKAQADDALDELIDALRFCDEWRTSPLSRPWFDSFFWRGSLAAELGCTEPHRSALVPLRSAIAGAETELRNHLSPEFVDELLSSIRCAVKSASYEICCTMCRRFIAARVAGNPKQASDMLRSLFSFLDANLEEFPTYRESKAYAANHFTPYENKKYDSCYFSGTEAGSRCRRRGRSSRSMNCSPCTRPWPQVRSTMCASLGCACSPTSGSTIGVTPEVRCFTLCR